MNIQRFGWSSHLMIGIVLVLLYLTACSARHPSSGGALTPITPSPTATLPSATPTLLPSPMPTTATPSSTHTPAPPTITPRPTLTADERQALVREMLETNGGCELPCWWGIIPGETAWQAARDFFASRGIREIMYKGDLYYYFDPPLLERSVQYILDLHFTQQAGVVHSIQVFSQVLGDPKTNRFAQDWHRYSLDQVLSRYGEPSQIYIKLLASLPYLALRLLP